MHIEHIRPRKHGGSDDAESLCLACIDCNLRKGTNLTGIDPQTGEITELFHPRHLHWKDHFKWNSVWIAGTTPIGRTTVVVLDLNGEDRLDLRLA